MKALALLPLLSFALPVHAQHEGHCPAQRQDHSRHQTAAEIPPPATTPSSLPVPTAEERSAAFPDLGGMDMSGHMQENPLIAMLQVDQLETDQEDAFSWNLRAGISRNFDKLWLRSEGVEPKGGNAHGDAEMLWSHATGPWWDRVIGVRSDFGDGPSRQWLAVGVIGLAPYKFEIEATGYIGASGRLAARLEGEYEILLTNRWILQPKLEADLYSRDDVENGVGKGLSEAELALRLRYEFSPRFAPYLGYAWSRKFGGTADMAGTLGEEADEQGWVAGLRFWF
jgi:copper resistance protein B